MTVAPEMSVAQWKARIPRINAQHREQMAKRREEDAKGKAE
jgi:hypothetical protein